MKIIYINGTKYARYYSGLGNGLSMPLRNDKKEEEEIKKDCKDNLDAFNKVFKDRLNKNKLQKKGKDTKDATRNIQHNEQNNEQQSKTNCDISYTSILDKYIKMQSIEKQTLDSQVCSYEYNEQDGTYKDKTETESIDPPKNTGYNMVLV